MRRLGASAVATVATAVVIGAGHAWAQVPPPPGCPGGPGSSSSPAEVCPEEPAADPLVRSVFDGQGGPGPEPGRQRPALAGTADPAAEPDSTGGGGQPLLETVIPGSDPGQYPTSGYDLGYDDGGTFGISNKVLGLFCSVAWAATRWLVRAGIWIVEWSFSFGFADRLAAPMRNVADVYQAQVVDRLGLGPFFLLVAAAWCAFQVFRGRLGRGAGEFFVSVLIAGLAATMLASPSSVLFASLDKVAQASVEVTALTTSADAGAGAARNLDVDAEGAMRPLTAGLHRALVERPHELLNWGRFVPPGDPCRALYEELVATGPHGTDGEPRKRMGRECSSGGEAMEEFNADPTPERLGATLLVGFAAVVVMLLMVVIAASLIAAQLGIVFLVAIAPFPIVAGILPGGGRGMFWRWLGAAGKALATVLMTTVFLALFLVGIDAVLTATSDEALMVQMGLIDVMVICAFVARKRLVGAGQRAVSRVTTRLEGSRIGGTAGSSWLAPAGAGAAAGFAAGQLWDENKAEMGSVTSRVRHQADRLRTHQDSRRYHQGARALAGVAGPGTTASASHGASGAARRGVASARPGLGQGRTARVARAAGKATKVAAQATVGAPVYVPRASQAARAATRTYASSARTRVEARLGQARSFGHEYARNTRSLVYDSPRRRGEQVVAAGKRLTGARR